MLTRILVVLSTILSLATFWFFYEARQQSFGATLPQSPAVFETSLQSPITSSATSLTLTANSVRGGGTLSGYNCFTVDEGTAQAEFICGTVSGTTVTSLSRGISPSTGTTTVASLQFSHRRGANVKITDFPTIQILKAIINGEDTIPTLLSYATTVLIGAGSPTTTVATKYYVDNTNNTGAADADDTTKGLVEMATGAEAAAGTSLGGTAGRLALGANIATSTCSSAANRVIVSLLSNGKLSDNCVDKTAAYTWTGLHIFSGATTTITSSTSTVSTLLGIFGIGTSTPWNLPGGGLVVAKNANIAGGLSIGSVSTSTSGHLLVEKLLTVNDTASTSKLFISNQLTGWVNASGYQLYKQTQAFDGGSPSANSITVTCPNNKAVISGGWNAAATMFQVGTRKSYPSATTTWTFYLDGGNGLTTSVDFWVTCVNQ